MLDVDTMVWLYTGLGYDGNGPERKGQGYCGIKKECVGVRKRQCSVSKIPMENDVGRML